MRIPEKMGKEGRRRRLDQTAEAGSRRKAADIFLWRKRNCTKQVLLAGMMYAILYIALRYIAVRMMGACMSLDQHIKKVYIPMTETAFCILLCLREPNHGYGVVQMVEKMTDGAIRLAPGTMYGSLGKMEKDQLIRFIREEDKRKIYQITELGREVLQIELKRIERLYRIAKEGMEDDKEARI